MVTLTSRGWPGVKGNDEGGSVAIAMFEMTTGSGGAGPPPASTQQLTRVKTTTTKLFKVTWPKIVGGGVGIFFFFYI